MASRRKRGPVAFRHRLSAGLALLLFIVTQTYHRHAPTAILHCHYYSPRCAGFLWVAMSAMGQQRPLDIVSAGWPLTGVYRSLGSDISRVKI